MRPGSTRWPHSYSTHSRIEWKEGARKWSKSERAWNKEHMRSANKWQWSRVGCLQIYVVIHPSMERFTLVIIPTHTWMHHILQFQIPPESHLMRFDCVTMQPVKCVDTHINAVEALPQMQSIFSVRNWSLKRFDILYGDDWLHGDYSNQFLAIERLQSH